MTLPAMEGLGCIKHHQTISNIYDNFKPVLLSGLKKPGPQNFYYLKLKRCEAREGRGLIATEAVEPDMIGIYRNVIADIAGGLPSRGSFSSIISYHVLSFFLHDCADLSVDLG